MLWQTEPHCFDNHHRHALRKCQRERERGREGLGTNTQRIQTQQEQGRNDSAGFCWVTAAELWWAMGATPLCPSSSWFLILLAEMPLQSPHCLPTPHNRLPVCSPLSVFLLWSSDKRRVSIQPPTVRVNGLRSSRGQLTHINLCTIGAMSCHSRRML